VAVSQTDAGGAKRTRLWSIGVLCLVALAFAAVVEVWLEVAQARRREERTRELGVALGAALLSPVESLHAVVAFLETPRKSLSLAEFRAFCRPALDRHDEMVALEWFPLVMDAERQLFEDYVRREQPDFRLRELAAEAMVPAKARSSHIALTYAEPIIDSVMGLDLTFEAVRAEPAWRALYSQQVTLSDRFRLVEDPPDVFSVVAYAPVEEASWVNAADLPGHRFNRGVAVALFRLDNLVVSALARYDTDDLGIRLVDLDAPEDLRTLFSTGRKADMVVHSTTMPFIDRRYRLDVAFAPGALLHSTAVAAFFATFGLGILALELASSRRRVRLLSSRLESLGQYTLEALIGSGGMGKVYRARHAVLRRPAAIKIALPGSSIERFEREAQLHSSLCHPNTVTLYDYGRGEGGTFYVAMEYVVGFDLWALVQRAGRLPPARAANIIAQAAAALEEAHSTGLVHRDIKPSNIMVTARGGVYDFVKVLDFGLARQWDSSGEQTATTLSGGPVAFAGTPGYVAPEVIGGGPATDLSDIFSLGTVAYFLLEGIGPFAAPTSVGSLSRTLAGEITRLSPDIPAPLRELVMQCLASDPSQRPPTMGDLERRLRELIPQLPAFGHDDLVAWWREHPPGEGELVPERAFSLVLRDRGWRLGREDTLKKESVG